MNHAEVKPYVLRKEIRSLCDEADTHGFATVCIDSCWVREASCCLKSKSSRVGVPSVVGLPLGQASSEWKAFETSDAIANRATEIGGPSFLCGTSTERQEKGRLVPLMRKLAESFLHGIRCRMQDEDR